MANLSMDMANVNGDSPKSMRDSLVSTDRIQNNSVLMEKKIITTPIAELKIDPEKYANLGRLLADHSRSLSGKIATVLGLNPRQLGVAFDNAIRQTPDKPEEII